MYNSIKTKWFSEMSMYKVMFDHTGYQMISIEKYTALFIESWLST